MLTFFFVLLGAVPKTTCFFQAAVKLQWFGAHKSSSLCDGFLARNPRVKQTHQLTRQAIGRVASSDPWLGFVCNRAPQRGPTSNHNLKLYVDRSAKLVQHWTGGTTHQSFRSHATQFSRCTRLAEVEFHTWSCSSHTRQAESAQAFHTSSGSRSNRPATN